MHVLLVKLTSMGDLVHLMPALSDASKIHKNIRFTWVVDEAFAEIPLWHPHVQAVIPSAHRRWKKNWRAFFKSGQAKAFYQHLRDLHYDYVIDAQASIKSALITRLCQGSRHGMDRHSVREKLANMAYQHQHAIPKNMHAVERLRLLFSQALNYPKPTHPADYNLQLPSQTTAINTPYLVLVRNASWPTKLWLDEHWQRLIQLARGRYSIKLPTGTKEEFQLAQQLANGHTHVEAMPRESLTATANMIANAEGIVSTDTGLGHIAAALNVPCVSLYGPTDTALIGALGENQQHLFVEPLACRPCYRKSCQFYGDNRPQAHCMQALNPQAVWQALLSLIANKK